MFNVSMGRKITEATVDSSVPNGYGIYLNYEVYDFSGILNCIGRTGTIQTYGSMKEQGIRKRMRMKQQRITRNDFFKMEKKREKGISVAWFITFNCKVTNSLLSFLKRK